MKKFLLFLLILVVIITGCGKKETKPEAVTTVNVVVVNAGKKLDVTLTSDKDDNFIEAIVNTNSTDINIENDYFKDMDILESLETLVSTLVNHKFVTNKSSMSIDVKTPESKADLYRYLYKNALEPLTEKDIEIEIDFKFNE